MSHGSPRFRQYVLNMNRSTLSDLYDVLQDSCSNGQSAGQTFDTMLHRARAQNRPLSARAAALRGFN